MNTVYPVPSFHFSVRIASFNGDGGSSFSEVSGLDSERTLVELKEGGVNLFTRRVPDRAKYGNLILKRGVLAADSRLGQWCKSVLEGDFGQPITTHDLNVMLLDASGAALLNWNVTRAWPVKWSVSALSSDQNEIAVETLEIAYACLARS